MLKINRGESPEVVELAGRFDGAGAIVFDEYVQPFESRSYPLILDMGEVEYMSSAGIRSLVRLGKNLMRNETRLILVALQPFVQQTLEISGLLTQFTVYASAAKAIADITPGSSAFSQTVARTVGGRTYKASLLNAPGTRIEIWNEGFGLSGPRVDPEVLTHVTLNEMPLSFGLGGLGNSREQAAEAFGQFVALGNTVITVPADGQCYPDFIQMDAPQNVSFCVASAAAIQGDAAVFASPTASSVILAELARDFSELAIAAAVRPPQAIGFLLYGQAVDLRGSFYRKVTDIPDFKQTPAGENEGEDIVIIGIVTNEEANPCLKFREREWATIGGSSRLLAYGVRLSGHLAFPAGCTQDELLKEAIKPDRFRGILRVHPETRLSDLRSWIFGPHSIVSGLKGRMSIDVADGTSFPDEWDMIARRIYSECSRIILTPMSGGYMATTFHADSYDPEGRRMIPTVLKISSLENTTREEGAYHRYVAKFILNNSTVIMGQAARGSWAGLRYNFVGVNGTDSSLSWLADHYVRRPIAELIPLFEALFGRILWPWYGQPKREAVYPYAQHDPEELFPNIPGEAERALGVSAEDEIIACPELGINLPNPYHFLKHEFPSRKNEGASWNTSITHGDLNLNNILLDEKENIYVIDFSETRPRNIVYDFARLEPLLSIQMTRLNNEDDLACLLEFLAGLMEVSPLSGDPPLRYSGTDPMVEKAWHLICALRSFARRVTDGEDQPIFYWIPLLHWTLPIACFRQLTQERKRLSMYAAGLICRELQKQTSRTLKP